jgi:hypothetical protein
LTCRDADDTLPRRHERVTVSDRAVEEAARAFHVDDQPPLVSHWFTASAVDETSSRGFHLA